MSSLYCGYKLLIKYITYKYFLNFVDSYFSLTPSFDGQKYFNFNEVQITIVLYSCSCFGYHSFKNHSQFKVVTYLFWLLKSFILLALIFRSLFHLDGLELSKS